MAYRLNPFTGKKDDTGPVFIEDGVLYYVTGGRRYRLAVVLDMTTIVLEDGVSKLLMEDNASALSTEGF